MSKPGCRGLFRQPTNWVRLAFLLALGTLIALGSPAVAEPRIINIKATVAGCTNDKEACSIGADHLPPGVQIRLIHPVNLKLQAGTYRISHAGAEGRYQGWRFNSDSWWVWNFGVAINKGRGVGQLIYVALGGGNYTTGDDGIYTSLAGVVASNGPNYGGKGGPNAALRRLTRSGGPKAYTDTITLPSPATLSFFVLDYFVDANAGGVSLKIEKVD